MKHKCFATVVLAAALWLTGCGGAAAPAAPAGSGAASQSAAAAAVQTAQKERITDQYTLEKNISGVWEADTGQYISVHVSVHVPQLECDSPDAASINDELNDIYAAHFREYEAYEEAGQPGSEYPQIGVNWDAYWYGDCVSLVMRDRYGGTAPWRYSGWCFDFATGRQLTVAEMLQRMGLDPDTVQQQMQRQAMQTFDREMAQGAYYESWRLDGELSQMRMDTLEYNELENLCLLLPEQNQLVIRGRYSSASEERWQQLDMEIPLQTAAQPQAQPVLTDTYDGVQVQLKGTQVTITVSPAPKTATWNTELNLRLEQARTYPILGSYNEYVPFWLFDSDADAQLRFTATRTRCWSDSKYDYTETNYYSVRRDGTLGFDAVPVDGSSKIEDDLMESIEPFAMQDAIPFQTAYLAGYVADKYDVNAEESIERANKRIRRSTEETFQQTVTGYDSVKVESSSIQLHGGKAKYALFPVWLLSTSWRGENYLFAMNGQTGRFVGDLPVDKGAARKWMLGLTAALSAASYGVMWLLWLARIL